MPENENVDIALSIFNEHFSQGPAAIEIAARALADAITSSSSPADSIYQTAWDILNFSRASPAAIDFTGSEYANVRFKRAEVIDKLDSVIQKTLNLQRGISDTVIAWAVQGRACSLDVTRVGQGKQAWLPMCFVGMLHPTSNGRGASSPWSKADFVAACVGLRAGAKTFLKSFSPGERDRALKRWCDGLAEFLLEDDEAAQDENLEFRDGDFVVKYHAALTLQNLRTGGKDETSEELFAIEKWAI
ncbi:hypothetical protein BX600DRAFT_514297 [Xylariales sp. PMI_506]|nr:hypothetical protein BX600DRAFT_514297 [Xylariales sp. PMI_506]